ncbi:MAG: ribosomal RNA small subunit methyltransferase A [Pseudohongiella sp.]|nr:MAG: ribosomal RNA small subunit methyltransferase A [Pseudohongiella sp.]
MGQSKAVTLSTGTAHQARKRFGQNFLVDQAIIDRIIREIAPKSSDHLLEIGPGQGALTKQLARSGARLDCVELDRDLAEHLRHQYRDYDNVRIHQQDILKFDLEALELGDKRVRVIGNLPYNISTPVLFHLLKYFERIEDMSFMLQLEVVERMSADVNDKNYGRLSIMLQYFCQAEKLFNVPPQAFNPQPKVNSAIVRLAPHPTLPVIAKDVDCLKLVVRTAFNQRRKTLRNSLKTLISADDLEGLAIDMKLRPENLSLADYVKISDAINE